jgi:uncharacterized lipoprotein YmbA
MSAKPYRAVTLAGVWLLAACQSTPPTHYYALTAIAPTAPRASMAAQIPIRVERVTIPGELDRLEIVRRSASNRLQIATFDLWAASLEDMIWRVLADDLAARLPAGAVATANEPAGAEPHRRLYIDVQEFAGDARGAVTLRATWLLTTPNAASERGTEEVALGASDATADSLAAAMSRALAGLSDRIAAALATHVASEKSE